MMTGYGYNPNLVQQQQSVLQGVNEGWEPVADQSQFYQGENGTTGLSNPLFYGSMGDWYQPPRYNYMADSDLSGGQPTQESNNTGGFSLHNHLVSCGNLGSLAPPPQPRVSISDEELYQALNMSPLPTTSMGFNSHQQPQQQQQQCNQTMIQPMLQMPQIQDNSTIDYLSSEMCFPSTSTFDSMGYDQTFFPAPSSAPPEDPHVYHHGNEGDDEQSLGEPERYETMSPTFSIHSFAPTTSTNTAEAEDLEVELINNHKPTPRYRVADEIDIFLHTGTTDDTEYNDDSDSRPTTTFSHRSNKAPTPPASRPAYAQKFTAAAQNQVQKPVEPVAVDSVDVTSPASKTSPLFLQTSTQEPAGFTPLLTPNSDALLQKRLNEVVHKPPQRAILLNASFPAFPQQVHLDRFQENQCYENNFVEYRQPQPETYHTEATNSFDYTSDRDLLPLLLDSFKPLNPPEFSVAEVRHQAAAPERLVATRKSSAPSAPLKAPRLSDQELESESQRLALDVISNLFSNKKEILDRAAKINAPKKPVARNLFCNDPESFAAARNLEPINMSVLDDWETADDDDLTVRMENLLKDKKKEEVKPSTPKAGPPPPKAASDWDPTFLPHVLEIYGVPDYKMQQDVVKAMETNGNGDCKVMWMERKVVFAVFESVARAKNCLAVPKHDWLRFRSLADSPKNVQDSAKANAASLALPKKKQQTTATVARRMVESALGKKATVSTEKRQEERNQLAAAKAAKKSTVQWD